MTREIKNKMERIAGAWNGDESGHQEEKALWALEVIELVDELIEKLREEI